MQIQRAMTVMLMLIVLAGILHADAKDDLDRVRRDHDSLRSQTNDLKDKGERYLDESRALRAMDKDMLDKLVEQLCRLDIEPNDDEVDRLARDLRDKAIEHSLTR